MYSHYQEKEGCTSLSKELISLKLIELGLVCLKKNWYLCRKNKGPRNRPGNPGRTMQDKNRKLFLSSFRKEEGPFCREGHRSLPSTLYQL